MSIRASILTLVVLTLLTLFSFGLILLYVDVSVATRGQLFLFYLSLFMWVAGLATLFQAWRSYQRVGKLRPEAFRLSFRRGLLVGAFVAILVYMLSQDLFNWLKALVLIGVFVGIEWLALRRPVQV